MSRQIVVRVPEDVFDAAARKARRDRRSVSEIVRFALDEYLSEPEKEAAK